jgi:lipoate---protein ligase
MTARARGWVVDDRRGSAADMHGQWPTVDARPARRAVGLCSVTAPAVVLGSRQPASVVDVGRASAAGLAVARRRSGGGAVLVTPDDPVWIDVWVPSDDPLWCVDVGRAFDWLGETWARALERAGLPEVLVHRGGYASCTRWSSLVCFGGVGTGECVAPDGRKVVGLAQRRNRFGAWFHGACVVSWDPRPLLDLLVLEPDERRTAVEDLACAGAGVTDLAAPKPSNDRWTDRVTASFLASLP